MQAKSRGLWGHAPPENLGNSHPLRLLLVASETAYIPIAIDKLGSKLQRCIHPFLTISQYHQYGRYWYIGMARVLHIRNTNMHGKNSAKTERLAVKACYYYY